jgi:hypothetical protein
MIKKKTRLARDDAEERYISAGELEVFKQLQRDGLAMDSELAHDRVLAVGPFSRLRADVVVDELGKTRGAINNLWGSQEAFRAAVMAVFLNDTGLGLDEVSYPDPAQSKTLEHWVGRLAAVEIQRGPHHEMSPENRYGLRWAAWLALVPYGIWSKRVAKASIDEYRQGAERYGDAVIGPALERFELDLASNVTLLDVAVACCSLIEGFWLNACLTSRDPAGRNQSIAAALASSLCLVLRGATVPSRRASTSKTSRRR